MGQKVHPLGFRVGITKKHQSQWFARFHKYQYAQTIIEDRLLRQTLTNLLLNPVLNNIKKREREEDTTLSPKITNIKIERGLIPYQIGIQIHAENCQLIKSAMKNLKVNQELLFNLQKARHYLLSLRLKLKDVLNLDDLDEKSKLAKGKTSLKSGRKGKNKNQPRTKKGQFQNFKGKTTASRRGGFKSRIEFKKQKLIQKRSKKRQGILENRNLFMILKKGNLFVLKKLNKKKNYRSAKKSTRNFQQKGKKSLANFAKRSRINSSSKSVSTVLTKARVATPTKTAGQKAVQNRIQKKFLTIFLTKMNNNFLKHLKEQMKYWNQQIPTYKEEQIKKYGSLRYAPPGYIKKWNVLKFKNKPLHILTKACNRIERQFLIKLEQLRRQFITSGPLSKTQTFGYYQLINLLKNLKQYIQKLKKDKTRASASFARDPLSAKKKTNVKQKSLAESIKKGLIQKLNNIDEECRKMKFIEYLKQIVKKHRNENIYYYLSTIADSRKYLRKIQKFTQVHSKFLFGFDFSSVRTAQRDSEEPTDSPVDKNENVFKIKKQIKKTLDQASLMAIRDEKTLQELFIRQIERQRDICNKNIELTPKISFKFYSVNMKDLQSKGTYVADSIVDGLEKRQAFRKVIKTAKKDLLKNARVKGVKILVSGRLNGAEIARSEWVRSGRVPLQTLTANIDYCYKTASTIYGIIGVKVWIFKGYTKTI